MEKFWESLGGKLLQGGLTGSLAPAFVFWAGGFAAWASQHNVDVIRAKLQSVTATPNYVEIVILLVITFGVVTLSTVLVHSLQVVALQFLEGYWPKWTNALRRLLVHWQEARIATLESRFQEFERKGADKLTADEHREHVELDARLMRVPSPSYGRMPTRLGNILRAAESRPAAKYGLDTAICWPRLWLVLPESTKGELTRARASLDAAARIWLWGLLFVVWAYWTLWALPTAMAVMVISYVWMLSAAEVYGLFIETAFDVHRFALYKSLGWPLPASPAEEIELGESLTNHLWRGFARVDQKYDISQIHNPDKQES
jgi:hypothetical protein